MPSLHELQCAFVAELMGDESAALGESVATDEFSSEELLQVYRNNLFISLTDALRVTYPVVDKLVGEGFFAYMANRFIKTHPSRSGNLHDFGAELSDFITQFEAAASLPYLADVARLEWARQQAYHAAECPALDLRELQKVPPACYEQLRFRLHPSVGLISSPFPIVQIWEINQQEPLREQAVNLDSGGEQLLLLRRDADVVTRRLQASEYVLLDRFIAGEPLSVAVDAALAVDPEFDLEDTLRQHIVLGTLVALDF